MSPAPVAVPAPLAAVAAPVSAAAAVAAADPVAVADPQPSAFRVRLSDFDGPFDLLLQLISSRELDVTGLALARVTDDFLAHLRELSARDAFDLDEASEFLVVAATLLDLKAARLLPAGEVEDAEDVAALEARDLLFARLLQYRAYKRVTAMLAEQAAVVALRRPAAVGAADLLAGVVPEVLLGVGPQRFARLAARVLAPRPDPVLGLDHLHAAPVSVAEQRSLLGGRLALAGTATFTELTADAPGVSTVVARFLALLELYRDGLVGLHQEAALGEVTVRWQPDGTGGPAAAAGSSP